MQAAMRSMERSAEAMKKLGEEIPAMEKVMKDLEDAAKALETAAADMTKKVTESEKPVKLVAISPDGKLLAIAGEDQVVRTFDSQTGAWIDSYSGQGAAHVALAFAGPRELVSVAANKNAAVWDTNPDWKLERTIGSPDSTAQFIDRVTALDFSPTGEYLATGGGEPSRSGELKVWKVADGSLLQEFKDAHSDTIFACEFSPDGKHLATCAADRFMKTFEVATGKFVRSFEGHTHHVLGVSWQMDGRVLASAGADKVVKVWDFRTGDQQRTIQGYNKEVTQLRFLRDPTKIERFVTASGDNRVRLMRATDGGAERDFAGATDYVYAVAASADGATVIGGGADSVVRIWNLTSGAVIVAFDPPKAEGTTPASAPAAK
jgi:WD40 repeat protein